MITSALTDEQLVEDGLVRPAVAARFLGVSKAMIYRLMGTEGLPYRKIGEARVIPLVALKLWASEGMIRTDRRAP